MLLRMQSHDQTHSSEGEGMEGTARISRGCRVVTRVRPTQLNDVAKVVDRGVDKSMARRGVGMSRRVVLLGHVGPLSRS